MDILDNFLHSNNLQDPEDIDALLDCASLVRRLIGEKRYPLICKVILYTIENSYYEAFLWTMGILQEEFEKGNCTLEDFSCQLGGRITNYDDFVQSLQVDFNAIKNDVEKVYDSNGEVESFFNIFIYKTSFENIFLISFEYFDTKDNDYIQYRLAFVRNTDIYN